MPLLTQHPFTLIFSTVQCPAKVLGRGSFVCPFAQQVSPLSCFQILTTSILKKEEPKIFTALWTAGGCVYVWVCGSVCLRMCGKAYVFMWFNKVYLYPGHAEPWEEESVFTMYFHIVFHNFHMLPETLNKTLGLPRAVQWLTSPSNAGVWFQSLVGELGSRMTCGQNQNTNNRSNIAKNLKKMVHIKKKVFYKRLLYSFFPKI